MTLTDFSVDFKVTGLLLINVKTQFIDMLTAESHN